MRLSLLARQEEWNATHPIHGAGEVGAGDGVDDDD